MLITAASALFAQEQQIQKKNDSTKQGETSVENEYLSDVDGTVVLTLARSDSYDNKPVTLEYLEGIVKSGTTQIGRASCGKECRSRWSPYH